MPIKNLPLFDEFRDKLETILKWLELDGQQLGNELTGTLDQFADHIIDSFYVELINPVFNQLTTLQSQSDFNALSQQIQQSIKDFDSLSQMVNDGDIFSSGSLIADLTNRLNSIQSQTTQLNSNWFTGNGAKTVKNLQHFESKLEMKMLNLIALCVPTSQLQSVNLLIKPFTDLLQIESSNAFVFAISEFFNGIQKLIDQLNLDNVKKEVESVIEGASDKIEDFQNLIVEGTVEITGLFNKVEEAIDDIGIEKNN